ncbi:MAG: hypothetical protein A2Z31_06325 [candidate division NC10 bacterium RBG_16_65_8]|nr:MAG: hypothetical protein A2Z31_06325 [candidate division NC10 bacterium RBG_16_65_8]
MRQVAGHCSSTEPKAGTLLSPRSFGVAGMRSGPTLPALLAPNVVKLLVSTLDLKPITTPSQNCAATLG